MTELLGIDLSLHRDTLKRADFEKLHDAGCRFLGVRVSVGRSDEGIIVSDPTAARYVDLGRAFGWIVFGFHYLNPREEMRGEADRDGYQQGAYYGVEASRLGLDGHFLDVEEAGIKQPHIVHANIAMRMGLATPVHLYSSDLVMERYDPLVRDLFDPGEWTALYAKNLGGHSYRWLNDWATPAELQAIAARHRLWQFGRLRYRITINGRRKYRSIDGDVWQGTQRQLLDYLRARR